MFEDVKIEELSMFDDSFAQAKEIPEIPDGTYTGQVSSVILTKTKRENTPMVIIKFIDDETDWPIDVIHVLSIKAIPFLKKNLLALGFPEQGNFSQNLKDFVEKFSMPKHVSLVKSTYIAKNGKQYSNFDLSPVSSKQSDTVANIQNTSGISSILNLSHEENTQPKSKRKKDLAKKVSEETSDDTIPF